MRQYTRLYRYRLANEKCFLNNIDVLWNYFGKEIVYKTLKGLTCDITRSDFTFDLDKNDQRIKKEMSRHITHINVKFISVEMRWSKNMKESSLTRNFNMFAFMDYFTDFDYVILVKLANLHGIELNLLDQTDITNTESRYHKYTSGENIFLPN